MRRVDAQQAMSLTTVGVMARFSERMGHVEVRSTLQTTWLDDGTRIDLWNVAYPFVQQGTSSDMATSWYDKSLSKIMWTELIGAPVDEMQGTPHSHFVALVKQIMLKDEFHQALDVVEFLVRFESVVKKTDTLKPRFNNVFTKNLVGYRIVDRDIVPVTDGAEVQEVETALQNVTTNAGASAHLRNALALLSDRTSPDYANSIKESISAVESCLRERTGKTTLSAALKEIEKRRKRIHPVLSEAWQKLYAYAGDSDGIRHGSITESEATEALASYFLIASSSFINYVTKVYS